MSAVIRHLNIAINGKPIVDDVDLDIADGERVGLVGSSGSGKSMIARAMMGLLPATAQVTGSVELGGTQIVGASDAAVADLRGRYVGMVFQNPSAALNPDDRGATGRSSAVPALRSVACRTVGTRHSDACQGRPRRGRAGEIPA